MLPYEGLKEDEKNILTIRRHWWYFVKLFFQLLGLLIVVVVSLVYLKFNSTFFLIMFIAIILALCLCWYYWFLWRHDEYTLTNRRIIDINRNNIFSKDVIEFPLDKIQDVYYQQHGFIPMMVNFGEVVIETAGEYKNVKIELAPNPALIQKKISEALYQWRREHGFNPEGDNTKNNNRLSER